MDSSKRRGIGNFYQVSTKGRDFFVKFFFYTFNFKLSPL